MATPSPATARALAEIQSHDEWRRYLFETDTTRDALPVRSGRTPAAWRIGAKYTIPGKVSAWVRYGVEVQEPAELRAEMPSIATKMAAAYA